MITSSPTWSPITQHFLCASQLTAAMSALTMTCLAREYCAGRFRCLYYPTLSTFVQTESGGLPAYSRRRPYPVTLRRKLDNGAKPMIHTIAGTGYKTDFTEPATSPSTR